MRPENLRVYFCTDSSTNEVMSKELCWKNLCQYCKGSVGLIKV
jgi:hypothetical protein